ncbi:short subunit dehydrogenase [Actinophytocola oryzae]|uniref:Short subunit dehydrogenase n=1 Tax=Actinophytocola oryzae TaxID=502181 RepID=A0A4R7W3H6_9PSEU|nr:short subunit dehydrogenase [Actinophytocola oryzae]
MSTWFVTGDTLDGFGVAYADAALRRGDRVALTSRRPEELRAWAEPCGDRVMVLPLDVTDARQVRAAVRPRAAAEQAHGPSQDPPRQWLQGEPAREVLDGPAESIHLLVGIHPNAHVTRSDPGTAAGVHDREQASPQPPTGYVQARLLIVFIVRWESTRPMPGVSSSVWVTNRSNDSRSAVATRRK